MSGAQKTLFAWLAVAAVVTTGTAACSLILDFEEDGRPCGPDSDDPDTVGDCIDGYSCMVNVCVKNGSVPEGVTCSVTAHCEQGHVCTTAPFVCRKDCDDRAYGNNNECPSGKGCALKIDPDGRATGACVPGECQTSEDCPAPAPGATAVCVAITPSVSVCERSCAITCAAGTCGGNCGFDDDRRPLACQPMGMARDLACVLEGDGEHGDGCNLVSQVCDAQHACLMSADGFSGTCVKYCDAHAGDLLAACTPLLDPATGQPARCAQIPGTTFATCGTIPGLPIDSGGTTCAEHCDNPGQCDASGTWDCVGNRCVSIECANVDDCIVLNNGWNITCSTTADCSPDKCVDVASGYCAPVPPSEGGAAECSALTKPEVVLPELGGTGDIAVCAEIDWECQGGSCADPCDGDQECQDRPLGAKFPICNTGTGQCECGSDADCAQKGALLTRCLNGACVCNSDAECLAQSSKRPVCDNGVCICQSSTDCESDTSTDPQTVCSNGACICAGSAECASNLLGTVCTSDPSCGCASSSDCNDGFKVHSGTSWVCE